MFKKKEVNKHIGANHFQVLTKAIKNLTDPKLDWVTTIVKGQSYPNSRRRTDEEKTKNAQYLIPLFNKLIDNMLESDE